MKQEKIVTCPSCSGQFPNSEPKCPYCGTMHLAGADAAYRQKLDDLEDDLEDLGDIPAEVYQTSVKWHGKRIFKLVITFTIIALVAVLAMPLAKNILGQNKEQELKEQLLWEQETFATLDAFYDAGDFDGMSQFALALDEDGRNYYSLGSWPHYDFLDAYTTYADAMQDIEDYKATGKLDNIIIADALCFVLNATENEKYARYTAQELALVQGYRAELSLFFQEYLNATAADLKALAAEFYEDDYVGFSECYDYLKSIYPDA